MKAPFDFETAYDRRARIELSADLVVPVVDLGDLIAMKKKAGRPQDLTDIEQLERLRRPPGFEE